MHAQVRTHHDSWNAVFAPAAQCASDALSRWTNGRMQLELDDAQEFTMEELSASLPQEAAPATMVVVEIVSDHGGQLILIFEDDSAKTLVETLLHRTITELDEWSELEWSALRETGNICASAFISAIRSFASQAVLLPSPPSILRDYVSCVLEQAVMPQLIESETLLMCQTRMTREGEPIAFSLLFVPSPLLVEALRRFLSIPDSLTARGAHD